MYVCICKAVTDTQIRSAVEDGVTTMKGLRETLGCTGQCGKCGKHVKKLRDQTLSEIQMLEHGSLIPVFAVA